MIAKRPVAPNGVSTSLKKAVDWKIFELQSMLVSDEVAVEVLDESVQWFQPHHYTEIVEERVTDGRCGYPLCMHHLSAAQTAAYRIDYAAKKVFSVETSKNFCSVACIEQAQLLERRYDTTVPYSRPAARKLDLSQPQQASGIDVILDLLGPSPSKKPTNSNAKQDDPKADPPPAYTSSVLDGSGSVEFQFENGLPVPPAQPASTAQAAQPTEGPSSPVKYTLRKAALAERSAEMDEDSSGDHEGKHEETAVPATQRPVYVPTPASNTAGDSAKESTPSMAELFAQMNALRVKHNLDKVTPIPKPASSQHKPSPAAGGNKFTNGSLLQAGVTGSPVQEKNAGGAAAQASPSGAGQGQAQPTTLRSGTMGRRPGPRTVKWGENTTQPVQAAEVAGADATAQPQSILKQTGIVEKPAQPVSAKVKPGVSTANKEPSASLQKLRHGLVVERPNPTVMSEAAMLRKREVEDDSDSSPSGRAPAAKAARGNAVTTVGGDEELVERAGRLYIGGAGSSDGAVVATEPDSDDGDLWVDVDPAELLLGTADAAAAMSIEGYVAQVKRTIRVSPATTIKNLSYSPFPPVPASASGAAAATSRTQKRNGRANNPEPQDGGDGYDDDASMSGDQVDGDGEEGEEVWVDKGDGAEESDWSSDSEDGGDGGLGATGTTSAEGAMADGRSLFLVIWSTLDELFAGSLANVFERGAPGQSQAQGAAQGDDAGAAVSDLPPPAANRQSVPSRPPIAMEQQSGQHAFLKLLQRGLSTAESQLDLLQLHVKLAEDRLVYQNVKRGLLSAAASALQTRSNLQHDGGVSAGSGLESAAWTLIGILVVDAIVQKCQIGPLGRADKTDALAIANGNDDAVVLAQPRTDVAKAMWGETVEGAARGVLWTSERRRTMGRLRDGDLQILRSYFNYV